MAVSVIFAAVLRQAGFDVDYFMPWEIPTRGLRHGRAFHLDPQPLPLSLASPSSHSHKAERPRGTKSCGAVQSQAVTGPAAKS